MYFPYLRGKQFELIALREMIDILSSNSSKISPVIEPVKDSPTLKKTLLEFTKANINFNLIINPRVGDLKNSADFILTTLKNELGAYSNFQITLIIDSNFSVKHYLDLARFHNVVCNGLTLIHNTTYDNIGNIINELETQGGLPVIYNIINSTKISNRRYYRSLPADTLVSLDDFFCCQQKNADYLEIDESQFSEEHKFYRQDGYKGFSDFLTVGENYSDGGFLPFAIAIHLSYADDQDRIKVKHFVSDSNMDTSDIGGKFEEALEKLISWCNSSSLNTRATEEFKELHRNGHFPGLGSIKKLSIMNHIELVLSLI